MDHQGSDAVAAGEGEAMPATASSTNGIESTGNEVLESLMDLPIESEDDDDDAQPRSPLDEATSLAAIFASDQDGGAGTTANASLEVADASVTTSASEPVASSLGQHCSPNAPDEVSGRPQSNVNQGQPACAGQTDARNDPPASTQMAGQVSGLKRGPDSLVQSGETSPNARTISLDPPARDCREPGLEGTMPPAADVSKTSALPPSVVPVKNNETQPPDAISGTAVQASTLGHQQEPITAKDSNGAKETSVGGGFDDADDEVEVAAPGLSGAKVLDPQRTVVERPAPEVAVSKRASSVSSRLEEIRSVVFPKKHKSSAASAAMPVVTDMPVVTEKATVAAAAAMPVETEKIATKKTEKKQKRKGPSTVKRILVAKKEAEQATSLLRGKGDLSECIAAEDCSFLGERFWIFTVEQLASVLKADESSVGSSDAEKTSQGSRVRDEIITALAGIGSVEATEVSTKEGASATTSGGKDTLVAPTKPKTDAIEEAPSVPRTDATEATKMEIDAALSGSATTQREKTYAPIPESGASVSTSHVVAAADTGMHVAAEGTGKFAPPPPHGSNNTRSSPPDTDAGGGSADTRRSVSLVDEKKREEARLKLAGWKEAVDIFQREGRCDSTPIKSQFRLDGAIKYIFPVATRNFLKSIKVEMLWNFLSLKKTESGAVCALMDAWRRECGLSPMSFLALGKHLAGVASRVESAVSAIPCLASEDRVWMKDAIIGLPGACREFLIVDQGFMSAAEFLAESTGDMANELEKWRTKKGMEPLKGTGKVANISAWKAIAKEAIEAEADAGRVVANVTEALNKGNDVKPGSSLDAQPPKRRKKRPKKSPPFGDRSVDDALQSKLFLENSIGQAVADLVFKAHIKTAAELFDADTKPDSILYRVVVGSGRADSLAAFNRVVDCWRSKLRADLDQLGKKALPDNPVSEPTSKVAPEASTKRSMDARDDSSSPFQPEAQDEDPFHALSTTTRRFLKTIGITTAAEFLTSRTTDISAEFVNWRAAEGKAELRGLGAIASVSGWKSAVRNKAKEKGFDNLSELEPKNKATWNPQNKPAKRKREQVINKEKKDDFIQQNRVVADNTLPPGNGLQEDGRKLFAVQHRELPGHFVFLLSLRKRDNEAGSPRAVYATYRGFGPRSGITERATEVLLESAYSDPADLENRSPNWTLASVSVNRNATSVSSAIDPRAPFSALHRGCGLVEIGNHGAFPFKSQNLDPLKKEIEAFVLNGLGSSAAEDDTIDIVNNDKHNVLIAKVGPDKFQYLLYLEKPIEQGQTVAVVFPSLSSSLTSRKYEGTEFRRMHAIDEAMRTLSLNDLRALLSWMGQEALRSTGYDNCLNDEVPATDIDFKSACECRRRLCWVSHRVSAAIGDSRRLPEDAESINLLEFGRHTAAKTEEWSKLSRRQQTTLAAAVQTQITLEMRCALELDNMCGSAHRVGWCPRSVKLLDEIVETSAKSYLPVFAVSETDCHASLWSSLGAILISNISATDFTNTDKLGDFIMHQSSHASNDGRVVVTEADTEGLSDAMTSDRELLGSVACIYVKQNNEPFSVIMRRPIDVRSGGACLSTDWYRQSFWRIVSAAISAFSSTLTEQEAKEFQLDQLLSLAGPYVISRESFRMEPSPISYRQVILLPPSEAEDYALPSQPLFLGLVWPTLSDAGWRLEVGNNPFEIAFYPKPPSRKQAVSLKRQRDHERMLLTREINRVGFGTLAKSTKRLVVATLGKDGINGDNVSNASTGHGFTVADILKRFEDFVSKRIIEKIGNLGLDAPAKITVVLESIGKCFDSLACHLMPVQGLKRATDVEAGKKRPVEVYSGEYLTQFLFMLPDVLQRSDLAPDVVKDCQEISRDLQKFISAHYREFFAEGFQPPREYYESGGDDDLSSTPLLLETKIITMMSDRITTDQGEDGVRSAGSSVLKDLISEEEKAGVTDFISTVFEQAIACRATPEDMRRKSRRFQVGYAGVCCRHCLGRNGEGRYFFTSLESLSTSYTGLEKHFLRCPSVPEEVKKKISAARSLHTAQRSRLNVGSQQQFFNRLWARLHNSEIASPEPSSSVPLLQHGRAQMVAPGENSEEAFEDHIAVLDHLRKNKISPEVEEAVDRYYTCLDYAGRVYNTSSMPEHFSAEWLLAKVQPKQHHHALRNVG